MSNPDDSTLARRAGGALDAANVLLADLRDGLGPYLAIYLLAEQKWDEGLARQHRGSRHAKPADNALAFGYAGPMTLQIPPRL